MTDTRSFPSSFPAALSRRRFVQGLAFAGLAGGSGLLRAPAFASPASAGALTGTKFDLDIGATTVNITGQPRTAAS